MPDLGVFHPQVVHFVVALGIVGVLLRLVSLTGKVSWSGPSAALLLLLAAGASVAATVTGDDAHDVPERIPGVNEAVHEHEELGETTRNLFLLIAGLEVAALALARKEKVQRILYIVSGLAGLGAVAALYEAAEHGGELVYTYAGGVGTRSGDPADVRRLLVAGLYQAAKVARDSGQAEEAGRLIEELARQRPDDPAVSLLRAESLLKDRNEPTAAMAALSAIAIDPKDRRTTIRAGMLKSTIYVKMGFLDSARAVLTDLAGKFPESRSIQEALTRIN